jgi:ABC-type transport system involved in cytochrome c biogenesis permease subunit
MIIRGIILIASILLLLVGLVTSLTPGVNNFLLPIQVTSKEAIIIVRTLAGVFIGLGYLSIRFVFSASRVQIGNVLLSITSCAIFSKICSFIFDGITNYSLTVFIIMVLYAIGLYYLQKKRKNELNYNL